ncbi:MAG: hypothetical protein HY435_03210 [Candidatus Liptonbacteria bacterium]|nr:hypothetical protein [Candidatus Liptonbacteria bacterium]
MSMEPHPKERRFVDVFSMPNVDGTCPNSPTGSHVRDAQDPDYCAHCGIEIEGDDAR